MPSIEQKNKAAVFCATALFFNVGYSVTSLKISFNRNAAYFFNRSTDVEVEGSRTQTHCEPHRRPEGFPGNPRAAAWHSTVAWGVDLPV